MDETAKEIKAALKAAGFKQNQVTVRYKRCLYDNVYDVTIRDPEVSLLEIEEICGKFESIRRDDPSGEILSGGNDFIRVDRKRGTFPGTAQIEPQVLSA